MKSTVSLLFIIGLIACKGKPVAVRTDSIVIDRTLQVKPVLNSANDSSTNSATSAIPKITEEDVIAFAVPPGNYSIIDTGRYSTGIMDGSYVIVKNNDGFVDTIDRGFGIKELNASQNIYLKLTRAGDGTEDDPAGKANRFLILVEKYTMLDKGKKTPLSKVLPHFNDFSSPSVINNKVYYWQLLKQPNQYYKIKAAQYNPISKTTQSQYLFDDGVETDDTGYLSAPYLEGNTIHYYHSDKQKWKFSPSFKPYK